MLKLIGFWMLVGPATLHHLKMHDLDVETTFLYGELNEETTLHD